MNTQLLKLYRIQETAASSVNFAVVKFVWLVICLAGVLAALALLLTPQSAHAQSAWNATDYCYSSHDQYKYKYRL